MICFLEYIAVPLLSGIVASLFASALWWYFAFKRTRTNIKFSNGLRARPTSDESLGEYDILFKVGNLGKTDLEEVNIVAKLFINYNYAYLSVGYGNYINCLRGQKYIKKRKHTPNNYTHILSINLDDQAFSHFQRKTYLPEIIQKAKEKELTLWDIYKSYPKAAQLTLFIFGYDAKTGARKTFTSKIYKLEDIKPRHFSKVSVDLSEEDEFELNL